MEKTSLEQKLSNIQAELKVPKGQKNSFGNYKYRSCEDILEAAKPICKKNGTVLTLSDDLVMLGDRYYVKARATLFDLENTDLIENTAFAREEENKKGMDGSQITGTASSYARKYALNGLFNIDDTKDADTDEYKKQTDKEVEKAGKDILDSIVKLVKETETDPNELLSKYEVKKSADMTLAQAMNCYEWLKGKVNG